MVSDSSVPSIPNTGRMVDYWLGGSHHFPADVEAAKLFESVLPSSPELFVNLRNFLNRATRYIASQEIDQFVVFASGIPTCNNVHEVVPKAKVLYSDIDIVNIKVGREILTDNPNVDYTFCDVTNLDTLDRLEVDRVLGSIRRLGIIFIGSTTFIPDETLAKTFDKLYELAPAGSFMALDFDGEAATQEPKIHELLDSIGTPFYMRNPATIRPLLGRWKLTDPGILPVAAWQADLLPQSIDTKEPAFMYGCVVYK